MKTIGFSMLLGLFALCSCSENYLDRPILEKMSDAELQAASQNDQDFNVVYQSVEQIRTFVLSDQTKQAQYGEITYRRINDYYKTSLHYSFSDSLREEAHKEWDEKFPNVQAKVDSISAYWMKYKEEHALKPSSLKDIPNSVSLYWGNNRNIDFVIKELIYPDYVDEAWVFSQKLNATMEGYDKLCYDLYLEWANKMDEQAQ